MKTISCITLLFLALCSCSKNEPSLVITRSDWYLSRINNVGGTVHLIVSGTTNGDKVVIETHGDGLLSDRELIIDSHHNFSEDVVISFSVTAVPSGEFVSSTKIKAYKKANMVMTTLTSGKLQY